MGEIVDAHMHMWDLSSYRYPWLQEKSREMWLGDFSALKKNYLIDDYLSDIAGSDVVKCVHLQAQMAGDPVAETRWLQGIANEHNLPTAIIGFCDLVGGDASETIERHLEFRSVRGIRQDLNWHEDPFYRFCEERDIMRSPMFLQNMRVLAKHRLSFDLQIYAAHQYEEAYRVVKDNEDISFVLNHSGAPYDRTETGREAWLRGIARLSELPNLYTKLSGFDMYDHNWTAQSLREPVLRVVELFGPERCLFASNFPVSKLYRSYAELLGSYREILSPLSDRERAMIFRENAEKIYRI